MNSFPGRTMFCMGCGYILNGTRSNACPECGRMFSPQDPESFAVCRRMWHKRVLDAAMPTILRLLGVIQVIICILTALYAFVLAVHAEFASTVAMMFVGGFYAAIAVACFKSADSREPYTVY